LEEIPYPGYNPISVEGVQFGKALFESNLLSQTGNRSCKSCHHPDSGFSGNANFHRIKGQISRQIPSLWNLAWSKTFFWDGREENLESLVLKPIENPSEMNLSIPQFLRKINNDQFLRQLNKDAFGEDSIDGAGAARALSQYIRSLVRATKPPDSPGKSLFNQHCSSCHSGFAYTDFALRKSVLAASGVDSGLYRITKNPGHVFVFKTPGLADVKKTAPYMNNGAVPNLDSLLVLYAEKRNIPVILEKENRASLLRFLESL
jgi:cytochrome c peroxidase